MPLGIPFCKDFACEQAAQCFSFAGLLKCLILDSVRSSLWPQWLALCSGCWQDVFFFLGLFFLNKPVMSQSNYFKQVIISWSERRSCQSCSGSTLATFMGHNLQDIFLDVLFVRNSKSGECIVQRDAILYKTFIWVLGKPLLEVICASYLIQLSAPQSH